CLALFQLGQDQLGDVLVDLVAPAAETAAATSAFGGADVDVLFAVPLVGGPQLGIADRAIGLFLAASQDAAEQVTVLAVVHGQRFSRLSVPADPVACAGTEDRVDGKPLLGCHDRFPCSDHRLAVIVVNELATDTAVSAQPRVLEQAFE